MDSGTDGNFISQNFVLQTNISTQFLAGPKEVTAINSNALVKITHVTLPVSLTLSGNCHEKLPLFVIPLPLSPVVLGNPWLKKRNPNFDWSAATIPKWSEYCHTHCLRSTVPAGMSASPEPPEEIDLNNVPCQYHVILDWFLAKTVLNLPHRPSDCAINLLPGASIPTKKLRNISRPERIVMEKYLSELLAEDLIPPSSSPVGACFFFVEKEGQDSAPHIDYRGLNDITVKYKYPMPLIDSAFGPLHKANIFS